MEILWLIPIFIILFSVFQAFILGSTLVKVLMIIVPVVLFLLIKSRHLLRLKFNNFISDQKKVKHYLKYSLILGFVIFSLVFTTFVFRGGFTYGVTPLRFFAMTEDEKDIAIKINRIKNQIKDLEEKQSNIVHQMYRDEYIIYRLSESPTALQRMKQTPSTRSAKGREYDELVKEKGDIFKSIQELKQSLFYLENPGQLLAP